MFKDMHTSVSRSCRPIGHASVKMHVQERVINDCALEQRFLKSSSDFGTTVNICGGRVWSGGGCPDGAATIAAQWALSAILIYLGGSVFWGMGWGGLQRYCFAHETHRE